MKYHHVNIIIPMSMRATVNAIFARIRIKTHIVFICAINSTWRSLEKKIHFDNLRRSVSVDEEQCKLIIRGNEEEEKELR